MRFDLLTIFPGFFDGPFQFGVVARARDAGLIEIVTHDLREFALDRRGTVDDRPFGGDEGMVLMLEPICLALEQMQSERPAARRRDALRLSAYDEVVLICGRYEGVDERVAEHVVDEELSVGSFVLSGGEWAAGLVVDSVARLAAGVLGNEASSQRESFSPDEAGRTGILDYPHYTRPAELRGWKVPDALLSGNHEQIRLWRRRAALAKTLRNRPDLLQGVELTSEDETIVKELERRAH
jgi:tRNA (guanine37-N1)-methyltransferase